MSVDEISTLLDRYGLGDLGKKLKDISVNGLDLHEYFLGEDGLRGSNVVKRAMLQQLFDGEYKPKNVFQG